VVEVQNQDVPLRAIDARVLREVGKHEPAIPFLVDLGQDIAPSIICAFRPAIVFANVFQLARLAVSTGTPIALFEERVERFFLFTAWANFHAEIIAFACANRLAYTDI
jgi:hypothetical protein